MRRTRFATAVRGLFLFAALHVLAGVSTFAEAQLTVTINQAAGQADPTNQSPVRFTITFSAPVTGFDPGDISFTGTTAGGTLSRLLSGSGANYTLIVAGMTSSGNVVASVPAGVATDGVIGNSASTSTDNTVAYTFVPPGPPFAYVTNTSDNSLSVVSMTGLVTVATIPAGCPGGLGPTGIVLNAAGTRAYVSCYTAAQVSVIDLATSAILATIPVGGTAMNLVMNAAGTRLYVATLAPDNVAVIDTASNTVVANVTVGAGTRFALALSESANRLYVPNGGAGNVTVIDLATNTVATTVSVGTQPVAVSMNPAGTRAYVSDLAGDQVAVIDTATNTVVGTIGLGAGAAPFGSIVSPSGATLYTANHGVEGVGVVDTATSTLTTTIPLNTNANARGMAMTPTGNQLWVVDQQLNGLSLVDPATNTVVARVPVGSQPLYVALGPPVQPTVTINQAVGQADPALAPPINFTVTFSEPVTGFTAGDVAFTGSTAAGPLAAVVTGGPTTYNVAVSGMTSPGTVVASLPAGVALSASGGTSLVSTSTDNTVTFAPPAPAVTINQAAAQADPTAAGPINFTVTFSEPVAGFTAADVQFAGSTAAGALAAVVTGGPATYNVAVSGMTSPGTVAASVPAGAANGTTFGLPNTVSTSTDNTVTFSPSAPTVTINQAAGQVDPTLAGPINFTVVFSGAVTGFAASGVVFTSSTAGGTLAAVVTGGPTTFNVAVSGMTSAGTVVAGIPAGAATLLGVGNLASTSTDNAVTYAPSVTTFSGPTATGTGTQTASFTGGGPACTFGIARLIGAPPGAAPIPPTAPGSTTFPHGLFDFTTTGCTPGATLAFTLTFPAALPAGTVYWKYGPTASNPAPHWYTLPATIAGNTITFSITDGGLGDDDLAANGTIVDQGGPGVPGAPGTAAAVPTLSEWMLMLLATLMLLAAIGRRRADARRE